MEKKEKPNIESNKIDIEISKEVAEGNYSNLVSIAYSNSEFVLDFIRLMPGVPKATVKSRVIITPEHAARFLKVLQGNIEKYEKSFGAIKSSENPRGFPINFGGRIGEA